MGHLCRWRLGGIRSYNPEQIMLSAAVRRTSRDVSIMKEKLIFSGRQPCKLRQAMGSVTSAPDMHTHLQVTHIGRNTAWTNICAPGFTDTERNSHPSSRGHQLQTPWLSAPWVVGRGCFYVSPLSACLYTVNINFSLLLAARPH